MITDNGTPSSHRIIAGMIISCCSLRVGAKAKLQKQRDTRVRSSAFAALQTIQEGCAYVRTAGR